MSLIDTVASYLITPDLERLVVSPSSRRFNSANGTANVAAGYAQPAIDLPKIVDKTQGFYFPYIGWDAINNVGSAQPVTIVDTLLAILDAAGNEILSIGSFTATDLVIHVQQSNQFFLPKPVFTAADLDAATIARGNPSIFAAASQPLKLLSSLGGTAAAGTSFTLNVVAFIAAISGLTGADVV